MARSKRSIQNMLARVNFPLYTLQMLTERHVLVGGGGGQSKTGVANGFEIFELSHNGSGFLAEEVTRHETGTSVVMNCSTYTDSKRTYLVAGQESHCQLYSVDSELVNEDVIEEIGNHHDELSRDELRERKRKTAEKTDSNKNNKRLKFLIKPLDSVQTDFNDQEPLLRITRISRNGKILATGGTDGFVRLWKFPSMQPANVLKVHTKEIDDLDFCPVNNYLISIAKDGLAILWDATKGKQIRQFIWDQPKGCKYLYKRCRFGVIEGEVKKSALYTITNPTGVAKKQKSYLQRWLPDEGVLSKMAEFDESLSAIAVRDDGRFISVGTMFSGSVYIQVAFSLQKVLHIPGAHSMFVTGLEFLPVHDNYKIASTAEAAVLSISIDNHISIHTLPYRRTLPVWLGIMILVITLFMTFVFCSYLGL